MAALVAAVTGHGRGPAFSRVIYTESHDDVANGRSRLPEEIAPGDADSWWAKKRATIGSALTLTAPGIPMLFQGQELLEDRWFDDTEPLDWSKEHRHEGSCGCIETLSACVGTSTARRRAFEATGPHPSSRRRSQAARVPPLGCRRSSG